MNKLLKKAAVLLLAGSTLVNAAEMDITASFAPSMSNPENNTFINTTPRAVIVKPGRQAALPAYLVLVFL